MSALDVEAVLRDHYICHGASLLTEDAEWYAYCSCSEWSLTTPDSNALYDAYRAHVAAVLRVEIESALADVLRDAAADWKDLERTIERTEWAIADAEDEPFRFTPAERMRIAVCEWLTDRADQLDPHQPTLAADEGDGR